MRSVPRVLTIYPPDRKCARINLLLTVSRWAPPAAFTLPSSRIRGEVCNPAAEQGSRILNVVGLMGTGPRIGQEADGHSPSVLSSSSDVIS